MGEPFDDAWDVLKGRSVNPNKRVGGFKRRVPRQTTDGAPAADPNRANLGMGLSVGGDLDEMQRQANLARYEKQRHLEKLKVDDPAAYQKLLLEQQYAPRDDAQTHANSIADMMSEFQQSGNA